MCNVTFILHVYKRHQEVLPSRRPSQKPQFESAFQHVSTWHHWIFSRQASGQFLVVFVATKKLYFWWRVEPSAVMLSDNTRPFLKTRSQGSCVCGDESKCFKIENIIFLKPNHSISKALWQSIKENIWTHRHLAPSNTKKFDDHMGFSLTKVIFYLYICMTCGYFLTTVIETMVPPTANIIENQVPCLTRQVNVAKDWAEEIMPTEGMFIHSF